MDALVDHGRRPATGRRRHSHFRLGPGSGTDLHHGGTGTAPFYGHRATSNRPGPLKPGRRPPLFLGSAQVEQLKALGNKQFSSGDHAAAVATFTEAIKLALENHILYSNRSVCRTLAVPNVGWQARPADPST